MKSKCGTQLGVRDEPNDPKRVFLEEIRGAAKIDDEYGPDDVPTILDPMYTSSLDFGQCLSMHQPWASLLVHGIKKYVILQSSSCFKKTLFAESRDETGRRIIGAGCG